jgi:hypothetical protein
LAVEHFIAVAHYTLPTEIADSTDSIDDLNRAVAAISQAAAVKDQVGCDLMKIRQYSLKGAEISVDIRQDRDAQTLLFA